MKFFKFVSRCNSCIIAVILCILVYATILSSIVTVTKNTQLEEINVKNEVFYKNFNELILPQVHYVYKNMPDTLYSKDSNLHYDGVNYKWYPSSEVNMYCNKTCHSLIHIKLKIKT